MKQVTQQDVVFRRFGYIRSILQEQELVARQQGRDQDRREIEMAMENLEELRPLIGAGQAPVVFVDEGDIEVTHPQVFITPHLPMLYVDDFEEEGVA